MAEVINKEIVISKVIFFYETPQPIFLRDHFSWVVSWENRSWKLWFLPTFIAGFPQMSPLFHSSTPNLKLLISLSRPWSQFAALGFPMTSRSFCDAWGVHPPPRCTIFVEPQVETLKVKHHQPSKKKVPWFLAGPLTRERWQKQVRSG